MDWKGTHYSLWGPGVVDISLSQALVPTLLLPSSDLMYLIRCLHAHLRWRGSPIAPDPGHFIQILQRSNLSGQL